MNAEWLIVLNADGTVLGVDGGAPLEWMDTRVQERADIPADVRRAADEVRRQFDESARESSTKAHRSGTTVRLLIPCR